MGEASAIALERFDEGFGNAVRRTALHWAAGVVRLRKLVLPAQHNSDRLGILVEA
jgi:hypothetical protein